MIPRVLCSVRYDSGVRCAEPAARAFWNDFGRKAAYRCSVHAHSPLPASGVLAWREVAFQDVPALEVMEC